MTDLSYAETIQRIRLERDRLMVAKPLNWFTLIGLFTLKEGDNTFGSGDRNDIVIPALPYSLTGGLQVVKGKVTLIGTARETTINGKVPVSRPLRADTDKYPDLLEIGSIAMMILKRGEQRLLRVWDKNAAAAKEFTGLKYYPVNPEYAIAADFTPYSDPKRVKMIDRIGSERMGFFAGQASFRIDNVQCSLEGEDAGEELLFHFTDQTREDTTYPGGRFISVPKPHEKTFILDFNLASNWPCAYTAFATCPLTPLENYLPARIEAGEIKYH